MICVGCVTVEAAALLRECDELVECVCGGREHEHARVEAVGPAHVGRS